MSAPKIHVRQNGGWVRSVTVHRYHNGAWEAVQLKMRENNSWVTGDSGWRVYATTDGKIYGTSDGKIYVLG